MSNDWQMAYVELENFVSANPKIEIGLKTVAIPEDVRPRFRQSFDTVRETFLEERFPDSLDKAETLSRYYAEVEEEVTKLLGLADISIPASLNWFLRDPTNGLMRGIFDPLFDLLKERLDTEAFEREATRIIESSFAKFYRLGYEKWVALSLVKLLVSDKAFKVDIPDIYRDFMHTEGVARIGGRKEPVPEPKESRRLSFEQGLPAVFLVPDFIVHSAKINRYIAIKTELGVANWTARQVSDKREWYPIDSIVKKYNRVALQPDLQPDLTIYVDDKPENVALIADFDRICRPDLIIECLTQKEWPGKADLERIKLRHDTLKPKWGTFIVSNEPVPGHVYRELMPQQASREPAPGQVPIKPAPQEAEKQVGGMHILTVGFDQSKLEPLIELMAGQESGDTDENQ